jgi:hypothetical protein
VLGAAPVFAQSITATAAVSPRTTRVASTSALRAARGANAVANAKSAADKQIAARVDSLNKLLTRVQAMVHLTADEKSSISVTVSGNISSLNALQSKIDADATTTLKADIQSITKGERIYLLVEPQIAILAAADRAASIGDMFTALAGKIATRLASTPNATASSLLADLQAKVADVETQSAAAISETASLQPDNGVASVRASNTAALKDARSKIQAAQKDLKTAYQDAAQIVKAIKGAQPMTSSTSTSPQ